MPKTKISEFSATPGNNTDIDGINIAEGCAPSGINDAIRELMAQLKDFQAGTAGDSFNGPVGTSTAAAGAFTTLSATGVATFSSGTAGAPAITTTGDTNTGIFFPAADTVAASVGGTEGLRLTTTGLGVGTSTPGSKLEVAGQIAAKYANPDVQGILLQATTGTNAAAMKFSNTGGNGYVGLDSSSGNRIGGGAYSLNIWHEAAYPIAFGTNNTLRATLDSSGNLGLGVTPSAWSSSYRALELASAGLMSNTNGGSFFLVNNAYYNGTNWIYKYSQLASRYDQSSGIHAWYTAPSGTAGNAISFTQAMTLDASGNLGAGVTAPATRLEVLGANEGEYFRAGGGTISARSLQFSSFTVSGLTGVGHQINVPNASGVLTFATGSTERARITSGGDLLVAKTSTSATTVGIQLEATGGSAFTRSSSSNSDLNLYVYSTGAGAARFYVGMGGTVYATSTTISAISDQRLKENIQDIDVGLDKIMALKPRKFDWKAGKGKDKRGDRGWIAQELEQVFPEMVETWADPAPEGEEPYKAVNADLIPVLVKAIQELNAKVESLTTELNALKGT